MSTDGDGWAALSHIPGDWRMKNNITSSTVEGLGGQWSTAVCVVLNNPVMDTYKETQVGFCVLSGLGVTPEVDLMTSNWVEVVMDVLRNENM